MNGPGGDLRPAYQELSRWLKETPPDTLEYRRQEAELLFRRIGITFAVYGEADSTERLIPFDVIPRIISGSEWRLLEKGLTQRVKALNMFIKDIYSARAILRAIKSASLDGAKAASSLSRCPIPGRVCPKRRRPICSRLFRDQPALGVLDLGWRSPPSWCVPMAVKSASSPEQSARPSASQFRIARSI